ncbi:30S ribosomal protein S4e [Candidatus Micrarchaeota archaeon]|nr:30S ribosomal protein S4e [Candidatus Micrarchaeota archaeon]
MANKGKNRHLKRLAKSKMLHIPAKKHLWIIKASPGPHADNESMPLLILAREVLKVAKNAKEAKSLISKGEILVDGKARKNLHFGVGLMDVISIPKIKKSYQMFTIAGRLKLNEQSEKDAKLKSCRIMSKQLIGGGKVQLNLHDGKNILIEKEEDRFKVGDTVRITIPGYKVESFIKLEKGANCYIFRGKHSGKIGHLEQIIEQPGGQPSDAKIKVGEAEIITRKDFLFAVSKEFHLN